MDMSRNKRARTTNQRGGRSTTSMEDLDPDAIFHHIFPLLPFFTLLQFKLVCKAWYGLFSQYHQYYDGPIPNTPRDPNVLILGKNIFKLYLWDKHHGTTKLISPAKKLRDRVDAVLSCNGLICILSSSPSEHYMWHVKLSICIYNPLTRRHLLLGFLEPRRQIYRHFGFGFHRGTNEYKVVRISGNNEIVDSVRVVTVSRTGSWSWRSLNEKPLVSFEGSSDLVVDGSIHWLCKESHDLVRRRVIVSFDMAEEKFREIATPDLEVGFASVLAVLGGCLALTVPDFMTRQLHIWTMKKDGATESWTEQYVIRPSFSRIGLIRPVCLLSNGDIMVTYRDKGLYVYRRDQRCFEAVETGSLKLRQFKAIPYNPVIFSPW